MWQHMQGEGFRNTQNTFHAQIYNNRSAAVQCPVTEHKSFQPQKIKWESLWFTEQRFTEHNELQLPTEKQNANQGNVYQDTSLISCPEGHIWIWKKTTTTKISVFTRISVPAQLSAVSCSHSKQGSNVKTGWSNVMLFSQPLLGEIILCKLCKSISDEIQGQQSQNSTTR